MSFIDYRHLTLGQKAEARSLRPKWSPGEFDRFAFWVRPDGHLSRRAGHHTLTKVEGQKIDEMLRGKPVRSKGDLADYTTARFGLAP